MNRDIHKQAAQGRTIINKHERADLSASELMDILKLHDEVEARDHNGNGLYEAIRTAFLMGVAVGYRQK